MVDQVTLEIKTSYQSFTDWLLKKTTSISAEGFPSIVERIEAEKVARVDTGTFSTFWAINGRYIRSSFLEESGELASESMQLITFEISQYDAATIEVRGTCIARELSEYFQTLILAIRKK